MRYCSIIDCGRKHHVADYCDMHYRRFRAHGDASIKITTKRSLCTCGQVVFKKGRCRSHYDEMQRLSAERYRQRHPDRVRRYYQKNKDRIIEYTRTHRSYGQSEGRKERILSKIMNVLNSEGSVVWTLESIKWAFQKWSREVRRRSGNICQICGKPARQTHHIFGKSKYPGLSLNYNNGIGLCNEHHNEIHSLNREFYAILK